MPKYKVGDVAALFPKPSAPKSDTGKKILSMFEDFYKNSKKLTKLNHTQFEHKKKQVNNDETVLSESPREAKKKKRKYADNDDTESTPQDTVKTQAKQKKAKLDSVHKNSNGTTTQEEENYFPRNKKKSKNFNSGKENSAASNMHYDDGEDESFSHFDSEAQKLGDKKMKIKNKSSQKMKTFVNSRNQSEEFNVTDTSAFDETMEENPTPEKKSKKKKNKKQKKQKIVHDEAVAEETTEDIEAQNDEEPKIKKKSKKKNKLSSENISDQDSETEQNVGKKDEPSKASMGKKKLHKLQKKPLESAERISRTLFIGNLPIRMTRQELQKLFVPFGPIEACRFRGVVPVKRTIPKKVAAIKSEYHAGQKSCIGYIVFKEPKDAKDALSLNGTLVGNHHIVVNRASSVGEKKTYDDKRSIFIGNLPFDVEDEAIWSAFAACGEIEAVRAIRDAETGAGKGFGYVLFKDVNSKAAALKMEGIEISDRKIRIKEVKSNIRKSVPLSHNKFNAVRRKAKKLKDSKPDGANSRKSLKKLMNKEKRNYQKKKIAGIFKKFSF